MKSLFVATLSIFLLASCASQNYHYQNETQPQNWMGKNISQVKKQWGVADQVFHTRTGTSYYVYNTHSGANFYATTTNFSLLESGQDFPLRGQTGLQCSAIFKTDQQGTIISTSHYGSNCGGEWGPGAAS